MKVSFFTLQDDLDAYGVRCLSSMLRAHDVETEILFLGRRGPHDARFLAGERRPDPIAEGTARKACDLGGIHPLCEPEQSLRHADMLCLGEADESLLEVVRRLDERRSLDGVPGSGSARARPSIAIRPDSPPRVSTTPPIRTSRCRATGS